MTLEYADPTKLYAVTLTFTNQTNSDTFMMTHENPSVDQTIGYKLSFNGYTIDPGDSVDWNGLSEGSSNKDIKVTQIKKSDVDKLLEGLYSDTITVNLTPKDSM